MLRPPLIWTLLLMALACYGSAPVVASSSGSEKVQRWVVTYADGHALTSARQDAAKLGFKVAQPLACAGALVVASAGDPDKARARLAALDGVIAVDADDPLPAPTISSAPLAPPRSRTASHDDIAPDDEYWSEQWNIRQIETPRAWDYTTGSADALSTIAILDTGVDLDHPDIGGNVFISAGWNFYDNNANVQDVSQSGSGTMVAGVIAATANNGVGIAGVAWNTQIIPVKVVGRDPDSGADVFYWSHVVAGVCHAVEKGARVIHISVYHRTLNAASAMYRALTFAESAGAVVVAPVGDERRYGNPTEYPAAYQRLVVGVAGVDEAGTVWEHSNTGSYVALSAPGVDIATTVPMIIDAVGVRRGTGTILAAAHVSGAALLLRAVNPTLSNQNVADILRRSADDLGVVGPDTTYGAGLINVRRAVEQTPHRLSISPSDPLIFEWDELSGAYRQPFQSLSNNNTAATTWTTRSLSTWVTVTPPQSAVPRGTTPSIASVSVAPPQKGECGTRPGLVRVESRMPNQTGGVRDIIVRAYLPPCPPRAYAVFLPAIQVAPVQPVIAGAPTAAQLPTSSPVPHR